MDRGHWRRVICSFLCMCSLISGEGCGTSRLESARGLPVLVGWSITNEYIKRAVAARKNHVLGPVASQQKNVLDTVRVNLYYLSAEDIAGGIDVSGFNLITETKIHMALCSYPPTEGFMIELVGSPVDNSEPKVQVAGRQITLSRDPDDPKFYENLEDVIARRNRATLVDAIGTRAPESAAKFVQFKGAKYKSIVGNPSPIFEMDFYKEGYVESCYCIWSSPSEAKKGTLLEASPQFKAR